MLAKRLRGIVGILLSMCMLLGFAGCSSDETASSEIQMSSSEAIELTDDYYVDGFMMADTLDEIYSEVPQLLFESVTEPTDEEIEEVLRLSLNYIDDYYIRYSSGSFGLADIYVLKPAKEHKYDLKEELEELRLRRIREFEQYDVYDALAIAESSEVMEIGTYLVLVMIEDAEGALDLLEPIIPDGY